MSQRLVCVLEHPTQYDPPLWRRMAQRGRVEPIVWYLRGMPPNDKETQNTGSWGLSFERGFQAEIIAKRDIISKLKRLMPRPSAILTAGWTEISTWLAVWASKYLRVPVILPSDKIIPEPAGWQMLRRPICIWHRLKNRLLFDGFFTTGSLGVQALESTGVKRDRIARGLYPIDVDWWQKNMMEQRGQSAIIRKRAGANPFVVLAVAKWAERENPLLVLEAFARFRKEVLEAYLVLVGDGPLRPVIEETIQRLSLKEHVFCPGYVCYQELAAFYGAADVFIHVPRFGPWELSVLEAMACGVPVVATTNVGAAYDLVVWGKTGALAPPEDAEALAHALKSVADARDHKDIIQTAVLDRVRLVDVEAASLELEGLIERLHGSV